MAAAKGGGEAPAATVGSEQVGGDYVAQLEAERDAIKGKLDGMKASLAMKNDEIKAAKAAAREG